MNGQKAEDANVGMRLLVAGKATLTIGEKDLAISGQHISESHFNHSQNDSADFE
jgi:hypothetical protein